MTESPLSSHIEKLQHLLAGLQTQDISLSFGEQSELCSELDRFSENMKRYFDLNQGVPQKGRPGEQQTGICGEPNQDIPQPMSTEFELEKAHVEAINERNRLQAVMEALPIGVAIYNLEGQIIQENPAYEVIWGGPRQASYAVEEQVNGKARWVESGLPVQMEEWASFQAVRAGKTIINQYLEIERYDGSHCFVLNSAAPIYDAAGQIAGCAVAMRDITEFAEVQKELKISEHSRREAVHQVEVQREIVENREQERQGIAREIHDGPIQTLVSIMFDLQLMKDEMDQPKAEQNLEQTIIRLKGAVRELRDVVNNLRPPALLRFGLGRSLKIYVEDFRSKHSGIELEFFLDLPDDMVYFSEETTLSLYRLCQEGLNNIVRHAQATKASIRFAQAGENIVLEIRDDGKGFEVPNDTIRNTKRGHFGLAGMKERVEVMGGNFQIYSAPGAGTTIEVVIPFQKADLA